MLPSWHCLHASREHLSRTEQPVKQTFAGSGPASAAAAPSPVTFNNSGLVAWHCYSILGWIYANSEQYIVVRNPWGNTPATLDVDNGLWTPIEQFGPSEVLGLNLPANGVFALQASLFQQCFASYGWVTAPPVPAVRWNRSGMHGSRPHASPVVRRCVRQWEVRTSSSLDFVRPSLRSPFVKSGRRSGKAHSASVSRRIPNRSTA